jgi:hypothetical protein
VLEDEFLYAVIADHVPMDDPAQYGKILEQVDGKSRLQRALEVDDHNFPIDVRIVLSSNSEVLDQATALGAVARECPDFFEPITMLRNFFSEPDVLIDEGDEPWIVFIDVEKERMGEITRLRELLDL